VSRSGSPSPKELHEPGPGHPRLLGLRPHPALADGSVRPEGVDLTYLCLPVEETFFRMLRHREFEAAEMSLSPTFPADLLAFLLDLLAFIFSLMPPRRIALEMFERRAHCGRTSEFNTENTERSHRVHRGPNGEKKNRRPIEKG